MPYPVDFFYNEKSSASGFSNTPQGAPDVGRLINGRPYWRKRSSSHEKRKSLILADWTASNWSDEKIKAVKVKIRQLITSGFTVYWWQGDRIEPLTKDSLTWLDKKICRRAMAPVSTDDLMTAARVDYPNLTQSNTAIIDDYVLDGLLQNKQSGARALDISDLTADTHSSVVNGFPYDLLRLDQEETPVSWVDVDKVCTNLKQSKSPLTQIIHDEYSSQANTVLKKVIEYFPTLPVHSLYRKLSIGQYAVTKLLETKKINICEMPFTLEQLAQIEELTLRTMDIKLPDLQNLLDKMPLLKKLTLDKGHLGTSNLPVKKLNLPPLLKYLNLNNRQFSNPSEVFSQKCWLTEANNQYSAVIFKMFGFDQDSPLKLISSIDIVDTYSAYKKIRSSIDLTTMKETCDFLAFDLKDITGESDYDTACGMLLGESPEELRAKFAKFDDNLLRLLATYKLCIKVDEGWISFAQAVTTRFNKPTYEIVLNPDERQQEEVPPIAPEHNPKSFKDFKPSSVNKPFHFKNKNKSFNQYMVIEKLSQYLTITNQHKAFISTLQVGICNALSAYFVAMTLNEWNVLMTRIQQWDGSQDSLTSELKAHFEALLKVVKEYYFPVKSTQKTYLGDNCRSFLEQLHTPMILQNPWHAIAVTYSPKLKNWNVYDPNFSLPPQTLDTLDALEAVLKKSLGTLVFVEGNYNDPLLIKDPQAYLRDGGLLALVRSSNKKAILAQLPSDVQYSKDALNGLLLRDIYGKPAWITGIKDRESTPFTLKVLAQFIKENPDHLQQLQNSMEAMSAHERHEGIVALSQLTPKKDNKQLLAKLTTELRTSLIKNYVSQLETWNKPVYSAVELPVYCQKLVQKNDEVRRLIECDSSDSVQALSAEVLKHCLAVSRPVFYINSPDDLVCSAFWVESTKGSNVGTIKKGPGGALHEFLTQNKGKNPVVLINYDHFSADDMVRFNSLLDKDRMADGTPLSPDTLVLGFINPHKPNSYHGSDFYSRFDNKEVCPISVETLKANLPAAPAIATTTGSDVVSINLGHAEDWEERLLGRWLIKKDQLVFEEGELERALKTNKPIQIQNGLWRDPRFQWLWRQAMLRGEITHDGRTIKFPKHTVWSQREGYDWDRLASKISFSDIPETKTVILNSTSLSTFFGQYQCDDVSGQLNSMPGLLQQHKNSTLNVHLTRSLSDDEWGLLLSDCEKYGVKLSCKLVPGIVLPAALSLKTGIPKSEPVGVWNAGKKDDPLVITSSDPATTIALLTHKDADWQVIDISECELSALMHSFSGGLKPEGSGFSFHKTIGALEKGLAEGKKMLLHGNFSTEIMDGLAPLLLNPRNKGRLVLVGDNAKPFNYCSIVHHEVLPAEKQTCLETLHAATAVEVASLKDHLPTDSYPVLRAKLMAQRSFPVLPSRDPWQGMMNVNPIVMGAFDAGQSQQKAEAFVAKRLNDVIAVLTHSPYVYLTGPTAVGKSTFVEKTFAAQPGVRLYSGESRMQEWALDNSAGMKVLFIDEVNISSRQWSEMEGLFNTPPGILINGNYYPLSASHKVIFAGNPLNYGGERQKSPLLERHGNAVLFEPLSPEFIYEYLLKPVFAGTSLESQSLALVAPVLDVYRFISEQTQKDVLISPRELQMMALMTVSYAQQHPDATAEDHLVAARTYAYRLGLHLNTEAKKIDFEKKFKPKNLLSYDVFPAKKTDFIVTPSYQEVIQQLNDVLNLRQFRENAQHEAQRYGGLGGIVLEGEPGIGKSELVLSELLARGYKEVHDFYGAPNLNASEKTFYRMPVSMQNSDKEILLLKAFHEGAVVLVDEINSSPMMERLLNSLLMGLTPEQKRPKKPGFLIIGTQNSASLAGRQVASTALARRLITTSLPVYDAKEMQTILVSNGLEPKEAVAMIEAYQHNRKRAQKEQLNPIPTFRDLLNLVDKLGVNQIKPGKKMTVLYEQIEKLRLYGEALRAGSPAEAEKTIKCADDLQFAAKMFSTLGKQHKGRRQFNEALNESYQVLGTQRASWKPLLLNILIAATGIGLIAIIKKYYETGSALFSETTRQKNVKEMKQLFGELEEAGEEKSNKDIKPLC